MNETVTSVVQFKNKNYDLEIVQHVHCRNICRERERLYHMNEIVTSVVQ